MTIDSGPAVVVFLGPTLPETECTSILTAAVRPPARRGDVYRAVAEGFTTVVLIDGEFHGSPSVWQREIIDAMAEGVRVHGASSMGALRAAELHGFGMIGHGRIFEWFRDGVLVADDEVALAYAATAEGYHPRSEPLVNIRATLNAGVPDVLTPEECERLIAHAGATYFADRSFEALLTAGAVTQWPRARRAALERFIGENRIDQKRLDAIAALRAVARNSASAPAGQRIAAAPSLFWKRERLTAEGREWAASSRDLESIAALLDVSVETLRALHRVASTRFFLAEWARATSNTASAADLPEHVIWRRVLEWATVNGIDHPELEGTELAQWIIESGPARFGYVWHGDVEIAALMKASAARSGVEPKR